MPYVEVVPNSSTQAAAPGWAYVPDTGFDPSKAPIVPTGSRKRARITQSSTASRAEISARQQTRITKHLVELDKENHKDVQIGLPNQGKDAGARGARGKMTSAVKKIVSSEKRFANHLADEEAAITNQIYHPIEPTLGPRTVEDAMEVDPQDEDQRKHTQVDALDRDENIPFLRNPIPSLPSAEEIESLLSAPPLSYNAARAAPSTSTAPPRSFCEMCGYWGRARCMKCGARVCGLECKIQHEETRCLKFYA